MNSSNKILILSFWYRLFDKRFRFALILLKLGSSYVSEDFKKTKINGFCFFKRMKKNVT